MSITEPFLRWAGGKNWFVKHLPKILNGININHYHEPFLGGASVFFSLEHNKKSYLSDSNEELIRTYITIRDNPNDVIELLNTYENTKDFYYNMRSTIPRNECELAARFIYLNQTSYNGIYRVNRAGGYNVPYGYRNNWIYDNNRIIEASKKLQNTRIEHGDFTVNKRRILSGDLVFLDPPYTVSHNNNGFIEYNAKIFSLEDQERLSEFIDFIRHKNAYYILTNAAHPEIDRIFLKDGDYKIELDRKSLIGGKNAERKTISEYIYTNIPQGEYV